jgi:MerR family mercuric resistance operon transcriptional regulator
MPKAMTIGQLAAAAGVHIETVRYYQRRGLLNTPDKPLHGHRRYSELTLQRLTFIRNAQKLAFTLGEVAELLAMTEAENCKRARAIASEKLVHLAERVGEINRIRRRLRMLIKRCDGKRPGGAGAIIRSLLGDEPTGGPPSS